MKTGFVSTSGEGIGAFLVCSCSTLSVFLFLFVGQLSAFPLWSEDTGVALFACLEIPECRTALLLLSLWQHVSGVGRGMLGVDKPCVIQWMAVANLCVSSVLIMESNYSFPSFVSFALF